MFTGRTLFLVAAAYGSTAVLRALTTIYSVDGRAAANKQDADGNNAVLLAAQVRDSHVVSVDCLQAYLRAT
jgi:hypothetical protein